MDAVEDRCAAARPCEHHWVWTGSDVLPFWLAVCSQCHRVNDEAIAEDIRNLTPAQQAELIGGEVEHRDFIDSGVQCVVGPWRTVQPPASPTSTDPVPGAHTGARPSQDPLKETA